MKIVLETTDWGKHEVPNHVYVLNDSMTKMIAYVRAGTKEVFKFKKPQSFDTRGRTFEPLEDGAPDTPDPDTWTVQGSKGQTYTVSREAGGGMDYSCSCPGFKFRGSCKHVAEFQMNHSYDIR